MSGCPGCGLAPKVAGLHAVQALSPVSLDSVLKSLKSSNLVIGLPSSSLLAEPIHIVPWHLHCLLDLHSQVVYLESAFMGAA